MEDRMVGFFCASMSGIGVTVVPLLGSKQNTPEENADKVASLDVTFIVVLISCQVSAGRRSLLGILLGVGSTVFGKEVGLGRVATIQRSLGFA